MYEFNLLCHCVHAHARITCWYAASSKEKLFLMGRAVVSWPTSEASDWKKFLQQLKNSIFCFIIISAKISFDSLSLASYYVPPLLFPPPSLQLYSSNLHRGGGASLSLTHLLMSWRFKHSIPTTSAIFCNKHDARWSGTHTFSTPSRYVFVCRTIYYM